MLPDVDAVGFLFGVPYRSLLGHRGLTHSIAFAALVGIVAGAFALRKMRSGPGTRWLVVYFTLVTLSHPLLDMMTNGGLGVALFTPFSPARYFLPWRPIEVSPIGIAFFSEEGMRVLASEIVWVWLPALSLWAGVWAYRKATRSQQR